MLQNNKFNQRFELRNSAEVTLTPMAEENQIHIRIKGKILNTETDSVVENTKTIDAEDPIWNLIFGGSRATKRFMKTNKPVKKSMPLSQLGYENCILST